MVRGIRGAITVEEDTPEAIHQATRELLLKMLEANGIQSYEELAAVLFTVTFLLNIVSERIVRRYRTIY